VILRRITLKLSPSMRRTAEALALRAQSAAGRNSLELPAQARSGPVLGAALVGQMPKGGNHGR
jgi:hypothetical protein